LVKEGGQQLQEEYLKINPKQEVPTLVDDNITLSQSTAIFLYLDRTHIENPLFPKPFPDFERCFELVEIINSGTQPIQNLKVLKRPQSKHGLSDDEKNEWCKDFILSGLKAFQAKLSPNSNFCIGDEVTAADMFMVPQMFNARRYGVDLNQLQHLVEIEARCLELEAFKKAIPSAQPDSE
jgi:maleylacetoacetate isomerase